MITLSEEAIRAAVPRSAYEAGRRYALEGRVRSLSATPDGTTLSATVQGSRARPYRQTIVVAAARQGGYRIAGSCSCPVAFNCKHVAAVLIAARAAVAPELRSIPPHALEPRPRGQALPQPLGLSPVTPRAPHLTAPGLAEPAARLPFNIMAWLETLERAQEVGGEEYPPTLRQRLLYVLSLAPDHRGAVELVVAPLRVHLRKDGTFSGNTSRYDPNLARAGQAAKFLRPSDHLILRRLRGHRLDGHTLTGDEAVETLRRIIATGRAHWERLDGPLIQEGRPAPGRVVWQLGEDGWQHPVLTAEAGLQALRLSPPWYADPATGTLGPLVLEDPPHLVEALLAAPPVPPGAVELVRSELARRLPDISLPAPAHVGTPELITGPPVPHLRLLLEEGPRGFGPEAIPLPLARLSFRYGPVAVPAGSGEPNPTRTHAGRLYSVLRSKADEDRAVHALEDLGFFPLSEYFGPSGSTAHHGDFLLESDDDLEWLDFLTEDVPALTAEGWIVEVDDSFPIRLATPSGEFTAKLRETSGIDWLELELGVLVDGEWVDLVPSLIELIQHSTRLDEILEGLNDEMPIYVPLADGRLLPLPAERIRPILAALRDLFAAGGVDAAKRRIGFSRLEAGDLALFEAATAPAGLVWQGGEALRALGTSLRATGAIPRIPIPESFVGDLRPYQAQGVDWLQFLRQAGFGALLADDMGLGKTVQVLAHLSIEKAQERLDCPALVICPTSVVPNWQREAARFAPDLRVLELHGPDRKTHFSAIGAHDLVITTYPLLARDRDVLTSTTWHIVVLDEAQTIKNPDAITTKLAGELRAHQRICLSGTPLENNLRELWSLFAFLAPGLLGDQRGFQSRFRTPIERHGDLERRAALARRVRPFLLRRTKEEVAADLPPKTEIFEAIEMGAQQRAVYESIRLAMHTRVREAIAAKGLARSGIVILDALLKLRQACCDPRLLKLKGPSTRAGSAKLERLRELLPSLLAEGRRVLLFSQFTSMLALIEAELERMGLPWLLLTGDTRDRRTPVRRFQAGEVPLFLISLKAGGTGLNLTGADTVIHYDPWWNPAVEDQATDRAHRIGQEKAVFVHKLVTLGTIEEKMEALKATKRALVAGILEDGGKGIVSALSEADVEALFGPEPL